MNHIDISAQIITSAPKTYGSYVHSKRKKIRRFFEMIAREKGIDPLSPEDWYLVLPHYFKEFKVPIIHRFLTIPVLTSILTFH